MHTIYLKTNGYDCWAEKGSRSELLLTHINHGERKFYNFDLEDIKVLASIHDWELEIEEFKYE